MTTRNRFENFDFSIMHKSLCVACFSFSIVASAANKPNAVQPNILFLLSDDAGYHDYGFQGSPDFKTPQIDRLAKSGVFCTNGYVSASVSGPSRAGILTGRYQQRFGYFLNPSDTGVLPKSEITIADALQKLGYNTGIIGKWHMGFPDEYQPNSRGFNYFYGFLSGSRSYYPLPTTTNSYTKYKNGLRFNEQQLNETSMSFYTTDIFTDKAIEFMEESKSADKPFFLYLSYNAIHSPKEARAEDMEPYMSLSDPVRRITGGMTASLDKSFGKLLDYLEQNGLRENTLVVWVNDNGGEGATMHASNYPLRNFKGSEYEGGIRVPFILSLPNTIPQNEQYHLPVISLDLFPTFVKLVGGEPAANLNPLDGVDIMPFIKGENTQAPHDYLFWQRNNASVRKGDWKLIQLNTKGGIFELYNLKDDIAEKKNLVDTNPEIVEELKAKLFEWQSYHNRSTDLPRVEYDDHYEEILYPNPFSDSITFHTISGEFILYDLTGKELLTGLTTSGVNYLNLPNLKSGTYFLQLSNNDIKKSIKIMKQ